MRERRGVVWASVALFLLLTVPFLARAHAIDDPLYLAAARRVLASPLDPLGGPSFWHDRPARLFDDLYNPPLTAYLLSLPVALDGGSEVSVHGLMILAAVLALLACAWAGESIDVPPRWTLLLASSPALAASAVSGLTDVPFLLLSLLAWGTALRGGAAASGLLAGAGALTKYAGLLNVPLALLALPGRRPRSLLASALMSLILFGGWCAWSLGLYGALHVRAASRFQELAWSRQGGFAFSLVAALGLAGVPASLGLLRWSRSQGAAAVLAGLGGATLLYARTGAPSSALAAFAGVGSGVALLWAAAVASRGRPRNDFLVACFWSYTVYTVLLVYFEAARYVLPLLPPLVWLLARGGQLRSDASPRRWAVSVGGSSFLTLAVLAGDAGYAGAWRAAAERLPMADRGFAVGHWGFQWYAGRRGYGPLDPREGLRAGDLVAEARGIHAQPLSPAHAALLAPATRLSLPSPVLRVMDRKVAAGFYSDSWGPLPFAFRVGAAEEVAVSRVVSWIPLLLAGPVEAPIVVDLGSSDARNVLLDGWSGDEAFDDAGYRRSFAWTVGPESALRLPLPAGVRRLRLVASPTDEAIGPLRIAIGPGAGAVVDLRPGWQSYRVPVQGEVDGGVTTIVVRPAGYRRPGLFSRERRELSVAVDALAFDDEGQARGNRGVWPVATPEGPALLVLDSSVLLLRAGGGRALGRLETLSGRAELLVDGPLWTSEACSARADCAFDLAVPPHLGALRLRAERAVLKELDIRP